MQRLLKLAHWIDQLNEHVGRLVCWLALVIVLLGSFNSLARYLGRFTGMNLSSNGQLELQWYFFGLMFLLGSAYTMRHNEHVRVDVILSALTPRAQAWVNILGTLLFLIPFCILMIWTSWIPVKNSWAILEMSPDPGGLPRFPIKTAIPVAFLLLLLQGISYLIKMIDFLYEHKKGEGAT